MGIGAKGTSLLHKLGKKQAWEMEPQELLNLVIADQHRRSTSRAVGRLERMKEDDGGEYTPTKSKGRPRTKSTVKGKVPKGETLEGFGLAPSVCQKLRSTGKPDFQLILELRAAGLI
jgi:hypothetical protein